MRLLLLPALVITARGDSKIAPQIPPVWDALKYLRGGMDLTVEDQFKLIAFSVPGKDYPINDAVFKAPNRCTHYAQPGFYADTSFPSNCQAFHRCDENGVATGYLCPNRTLFNQITLVCDWFFNVDCSRSAEFVDYSNSRLGRQNTVLLNNQDVIEPIGVVSAAFRPPLSFFPQPVLPPESGDSLQAEIGGEVR